MRSWTSSSRTASCAPVSADNLIRAAQAAWSYSLRIPPRRWCRRMSRWAIWSGSVHAPIPPRAVLPNQAQDQGADGTHGAGPARPLGSAPGSVPLPDQVAVPAQHWCQGAPAAASGEASVASTGAAAPPAEPGPEGVKRTFFPPSWSARPGFGRETFRRKTAISCRSTRISASLAASFRARRTSQPNTRTMDR